MNLKKYINAIPDYPRKGIIFRDISPLLENPKVLKYIVDKLAKLTEEADVIIGPDARGFLFGTPVAYKVGKPFVMVRKPEKLPGKTISEKYDLEYGENKLEIHENAIKPGQKVFIIDDLLATGGTTNAIIKLVERLGGIVIKIAFIIELEFLNGRKKLKNIETYSLVKY